MIEVRILRDELSLRPFHSPLSLPILPHPLFLSLLSPSSHAFSLRIARAHVASLISFHSLPFMLVGTTEIMQTRIVVCVGLRCFPAIFVLLSCCLHFVFVHDLSSQVRAHHEWGECGEVHVKCVFLHHYHVPSLSLGVCVFVCALHCV